MAAVVQLLLVLALLVVHSQGQSEGISGLVDNSTLTEWGRFTGTVNLRLSQDLDDDERQYLFPGLRFRCSGTVTKWIVGANFVGSFTRNPALGIYRVRPGGGAADRVGATVLVQSNSASTFIYEFTPDPPLPFQTNDTLGIYVPPDNDLHLRPFYRQITGAPASRSYIPLNPPTLGVSRFDFVNDPTEETDRLPMVTVEIESGDPNSADCTRDFISRDLMDLLVPNRRIHENMQILFARTTFTADGNVTSWTVAAEWSVAGGRNRFPELQIFRRRSSSGDIFDRIAGAELTATGESPNQLYSGTIDPPLQFQSGDVLGMYTPPNVDGGTRLQVLFADDTGTRYEIRSANAPLPTITLGFVDNNNKLLLSLETRLEAPPPTTPTQSTDSEGTTPSASALCVPKTIGIIVGAFIGGIVLTAVIVLIIVACCACARKKKQNPEDSKVDAIDMTATAKEIYNNPVQRTYQSRSTAISTEQNKTYASTGVPTAPNKAYGNTRDGDTTGAEYEYI